MTPSDPQNPSQKRRPVPHWLVAMVTFAIVLLAIMVYLRFGPLDGPIPDGAGADYVTLQRGYTVQGFPYLGSPNAPVLVENFSSYVCPHCRDFHDDIFPDLLDGIAAGQVQFVFIPIAHIGAGAANA
ncbi:MAG: DsbA family protein, partial [Anaerolineae bacterium]|nr:DsbA family protein [Anaerolineae bacterium]